MRAGYIGRWTRRPATGDISPKTIPDTKPDRAIDLSCRACGAGAWALGLDSRLGPPLRSGFHPQPPIFYDFAKISKKQMYIGGWG